METQLNNPQSHVSPPRTSPTGDLSLVRILRALTRGMKRRQYDSTTDAAAEDAEALRPYRIDVTVQELQTKMNTT